MVTVIKTYPAWPPTPDRYCELRNAFETVSQRSCERQREQASQGEVGKRAGGLGKFRRRGCYGGGFADLRDHCRSRCRRRDLDGLRDFHFGFLRSHRRHWSLRQLRWLLGGGHIRERNRLMR